MLRAFRHKTCVSARKGGGRAHRSPAPSPPGPGAEPTGFRPANDPGNELSPDAHLAGASGLSGSDGGQTAAASPNMLRVMVASTGMPGPIVVEKKTFFR